MSQAVQSRIIQTGRINWNDDECKIAARAFVPMRYAQPNLTIPVLCELCQDGLPEDRRRSFTDKPSSAYAMSTRLQNIWNEFAQREPEHARRLLEEAKVPPEIPPAIAEPEETKEVEQQPRSIVNWHAETVQASPPPVTATAPSQPQPYVPAAPTLGPMEMAMSALVQRAVEGSVMSLINEMDARFQAMEERIQELMNAQHDSLLCYFDPELKKVHEVQAAFITEGISNARARLETVRVTKRRVLIVCTNNVAGIQRTLEPKFSGLDFIFIDGGANKLQASGFYDLVLCNATNRPAVKDKLVHLHGTKVVFTDGGTASMIEHIRKRFSI